MRHTQPLATTYDELLMKAKQLKEGGYTVPPELFSRLSGLASRYR